MRRGREGDTHLTLNRAQKLLSTPAGSQKTYDDAAAAERKADAQLNSAREALRLEEAGFRKEDIDLAKAQLDEREAMVKSAKLNLADADLIAPSAGIILSRVREVGQSLRPAKRYMCSALPIRFG